MTHLDTVADQQLRWSGPTRAVQIHLDTFSRTHDAVRSMAMKPKLMESRHLPPRMLFWLDFARSYQTTKRLVDGSTHANRDDHTVPLDHPANVRTAQELLAFEYDLLNQGDTHYVAASITDLITQAAELAGPEPLYQTDLPCPHGFAVFEEPVVVPDLHPETGVVDRRIEMPVRAIGWTTTSHIGVPESVNDDGHATESAQGVVLVMYTDAQSYNSIYVSSLHRIGVAASFAHPGFKGLIPIEVNPWSFGRQWQSGGDSMDDHNLERRSVVSSVAYHRRWALTFFRLMWQRILVPTAAPWDRAARRRADRAGIGAQRDVKVLQLRRAINDDGHEVAEGERGWSLDHRIIVRGHPRRQYYPSLGAVGDPAAYRLIWIAPHIKGPSSAPLVVKHAVTSVVR